MLEKIVLVSHDRIIEKEILIDKQKKTTPLGSEKLSFISLKADIPCSLKG